MLPAWPWCPAVDTITMMLPRVLRSTISRATCLVQRKVPVRLTASWRCQRALAAEDAGVVDEDVDAAPRLADARYHRLDLALVGDVGDQAERLAAAPADGPGALLGVVGRHVHAHDARALGGQALGDA